MVKFQGVYKLKRVMIVCPACAGDGTIDLEVPRPQNFNRDIGEVDVVSTTCHACDGRCEIEMDDYDEDLDNEE